jgi:hypothetical protein
MLGSPAEANVPEPEPLPPSDAELLQVPSRLAAALRCGALELDAPPELIAQLRHVLVGRASREVGKLAGIGEQEAIVLLGHLYSRSRP